VKLALIALLVCTSAFAVKPDCLRQFANAAEADGVDSEALITEAHAALVNQLGSRLSPDTLDKWITGENPFAFPEQAGTDLAALRKNLFELERMVEIKGWNTPTIRKALLARLAQRRLEQTVAEAKTKQLDDHLWLDYETAFPSRQPLKDSPNGKWLVSIDTEPSMQGTKKTLVVLDTTTKKVELIPWGLPEAKGKSEHFEFSLDGTELLVPEAGKKSLMRLPLVDGKPEWTKVTYITHEGAAEKETSPLLLSNSGNFAYSYDQGDGPIRFDLKNNGSLQINIGEFEQGRGHAQEWGPVPGTDELYFLCRKDDTTLALYTAAVTANGKLVQTAKPAEWSGDIIRPMKGADVRIAGGKYFAFRGMDKGISVVKSPGATPELLLTRSTNPTQGYTVDALQPDGKGETVAALYSEDTNHHRVRIIRTSTLKTMADFSVPQASGVQYSRDGKRLFLKLGKTDVSVINLQKYLDSERP